MLNSSNSIYPNQPLSTPAIGHNPNQPLGFKFPLREFGKTLVAKRSFQGHWFERWVWLHYDEAQDLAFCYICVFAYKNDKLQSSHCLERTFISTGFSNWKDTVAKLMKHKASGCHKGAIMNTTTLLSTTIDVSETISSQHAKERAEKRKCFLKLLSNARFLSRQALAFRGDGDEQDSNFTRLIYLRSEDNPKLIDWINQKTNKYTSGEMQNEMVKFMALRVLRAIFKNLQDTIFFTLIVDETTDVANVEQVVICIRWVNEKFEAEEEFVGLYEVESTGAEAIYSVITYVFLRANLSLSKVRRQCYDGAATMAGAKTGVATRLCAVVPRAVFTHCYGHSLNLACCDVIEPCKLMQDDLDRTNEVTKLIKGSPAREAVFKRLREQMDIDGPGIRFICPTRWTIRAEALKSILDNYKFLSSSGVTLCGASRILN